MAHGGYSFPPDVILNEVKDLVFRRARAQASEDCDPDSAGGAENLPPQVRQTIAGRNEDAERWVPALLQGGRAQVCQPNISAYAGCGR